jgi:hypothetical protein
MKVTLSLTTQQKKVSASELNIGEIVTLSDNSGYISEHTEDLRLVTELGIVYLAGGFKTSPRTETEKLYYRLPAGTKITLEAM